MVSRAGGGGVSDSIEATVRAVMADVLGVDPTEIDADASRDSIPAWDSANHISLTLALEQEFAVALDVAEIESMQSFADIVALLEARR
jgi:acyl carrier protein